MNIQEKINNSLEKNIEQDFESILASKDTLKSQNAPYRLHPQSSNSYEINFDDPAYDVRLPPPAVLRAPDETVAYYGNPTNPSTHNPASYRYHIVSYNKGVQYGAEDILTTYRTQESVNKFQKDVNSIHKSRVNFKHLNERASISTSMIDQSHRGTYGLAGYIIRTTPNNIITASNTDINFPNWNDNYISHYLMTRSPLGSFANADNLLGATRYNPVMEVDYNEIVIGGKQWNLGPIDVMGIFYKEYNDIPLSPSLLNTMASNRSNALLPQIPIEATPEEVRILEEGEE